MTSREKQIIWQLRVKTRRKSQLCYSPGCNKSAIRSHIHQAEGPLRRIASEGKVVQLEYANKSVNSYYRFRKVGIKDKNGDVLTFFGFCDTCDSRIFRPIEVDQYDVTIYKNQLLHAYRGMLNELYKQEYNVKWYQAICANPEISNEIKRHYERVKMNQMLGCSFGYYYKKMIEYDLENGFCNFEFLILKIPYIEICTSAIFTFPCEIKVTNELIEKIERKESVRSPANCIFINILPLESNTYCIIGQPKDDSLVGRIDFAKLTKLNQNSRMKWVSDVLIQRIESWCMSTALYESFGQKKQKQIIHEIHKYLPASKKNCEVKFNLFKEYCT